LPIDARSNVHSLGAVFLAAITAPDGERLPVAGPAEDVIARAMATEPEKRDLNPSEFIVALAIALGFRTKGEAGPAPEPPKQAESAQRPAPREQDFLASETPPETPAPEPQPRQTGSDSVEPTGAQRARTAKPKSPAPHVPSPRRPTPQPDGAREPEPERTTSRPRVPMPPRPRRPAVPLRAPRRISPVAAGLAVAVLACLLAAMVLGRNVSSEAKSTRAESAAFAVELPKEWARRASSALPGSS
jgi:hypothetical protein